MKHVDNWKQQSVIEIAITRWLIACQYRCRNQGQGLVELALILLFLVLVVITCVAPIGNWVGIRLHEMLLGFGS
jgi:hypothetical protein